MFEVRRRKEVAKNEEIFTIKTLKNTNYPESHYTKFHAFGYTNRMSQRNAEVH